MLSRLPGNSLLFNEQVQGEKDCWTSGAWKKNERTRNHSQLCKPE